MSRGNDVTMVLALNRISALFGISFEMLYATHSSDTIVFCWAKFHKNLFEKFGYILEFL